MKLDPSVLNAAIQIAAFGLLQTTGIYHLYFIVMLLLVAKVAIDLFIYTIFILNPESFYEHDYNRSKVLMNVFIQCLYVVSLQQIFLMGYETFFIVTFTFVAASVFFTAHIIWRKS